MHIYIKQKIPKCVHIILCKQYYLVFLETLLVVPFKICSSYVHFNNTQF